MAEAADAPADSKPGNEFIPPAILAARQREAQDAARKAAAAAEGATKPVAPAPSLAPVAAPALATPAPTPPVAQAPAPTPSIPAVLPAGVAKAMLVQSQRQETAPFLGADVVYVIAPGEERAAKVCHPGRGSRVVAGSRLAAAAGDGAFGDHTVNLFVFLDGEHDTSRGAREWVTQVPHDETGKPGSWHWPTA